VAEILQSVRLCGGLFPPASNSLDGKTFPGEVRAGQNEQVESGTQQATCPRCGGSAEVRTVQELFDMLNSMQDAAMQQAGQFPQRDPDAGPPQRDWLIYGQDPRDASPDQEVANAALAMATRFIGRAIGKRMRRTYGERIVPTLEARTEQARRASRQEQAAIVERYPELRGCLHDQVVFLAGGTRSVPIADIPMPITVAHADTLVDSLRAP
jgi:hypothetical protein